MAGRGRGRGRGVTLSFNLEGLGFQRSDLMAAKSPPKVFPPLPRIPIPDTSYDTSDLKLLEIKRELQARYRQRSALLTLEDKKRDIDRYSDKYQLNQQNDQAWTPEWTQFPDELRPNRPRKRRKVTVVPNLEAARTSTTSDRADILARAKNHMGTESAQDAERDVEEEKSEEEEEGEEEEEEVDEIDEDETDYNMNYFDNGEGYGDDDDDDDEPSYT